MAWRGAHRRRPGMPAAVSDSARMALSSKAAIEIKACGMRRKSKAWRSI